LNLYNYSPALSLAKEALTYRSVRQDMISSNIANISTPYYRPRDINFEDILQEKASEVYRDKSQDLAMANTQNGHFDEFLFDKVEKSEIFFRDGQMARNDGNSVDLDIESTEMAKNSTMFNALINGIKKNKMIFQAVIDASGKAS
jgi:flagellar basal-body rod protein FlgB